MRILRLIAVVAALSCIAVQWTPGVRAAGPVTEVLIGELLPLTGNFASLGQQYLWAGADRGGHRQQRLPGSRRCRSAPARAFRASAAPR